MMLTKHLSTESSPPARQSAYLATGERTGYFIFDAAAIVPIDFPTFTVSAEPIENGTARSRRERISAYPRKVAALQRARLKIAGELDTNPAFSVTKLRLNAGLSQAQLATLLNTQQPAIARLEKGQTEPQLSTLQKLAEAFGVPIDVVCTAFINTRNALGKT